MYCSCDRAQVYPQVAQAVVTFADRFTGAQRTLSPPALPAFVEITAANELDVVGHNPELATRYRSALLALFARAGRHLSAPAHAAWNDWGRLTAPQAAARASG